MALKIILFNRMFSQFLSIDFGKDRISEFIPSEESIGASAHISEFITSGEIIEAFH